MSFLVRVQLPDEPGSLGALAEAFGVVGGNIQSVDIVDVSPTGTVTDDIVIELPTGSMPDTLITAVSAVDGAEVDSIRPFAGRVDRRGQIVMLADLARQRANRQRAIEGLVERIPQSMTATWAIMVASDETIHRVAESQAAPGDDGTVPSAIDVTTARTLHPEDETWIPESWSLLDTALAAAALPGTELTLILGRHGGPDFLASEVEHLGNLADIVGPLLAQS
ncbi:amino acid-binding ACT domain protein [Corynebacterium tapiri]|uniref:Amino acid-binding ACT domain protein n=1 Tax=Corynebacterium tapiri TaxID=1448266 RepID=A0A5C4U7A4_9CORY|nr:amino acid-binding ACT domain protein [Corynebacterium tapiri]TNL99765.1 amino acid-binding ACT domain protein [Corynebacterium tapiri]